MTTNGRNASKPTIVLIHGLWLTPRSWEGWIDRYQKAGYNVLAPSWPGLEGEVEAIRKDPSALKGLKLKTVVDHYERIIRKLASPPILIGHSFGGLIVQMLVDRGLGSAGVVIDSAQSAGVPVLPLSTIWATITVLGNPFTFNGTSSLSPKKFNYAFTNELNEVESKKVYDRYQIPGSNRILWEGALSLLNPNASSKVNYANNNRAPLLFIAGGNDHLVPPAINKANMRKYVKNSSAVTDYREFPNRTHHTVGQEGWEEVADFALQWANANAHGQVSLADVKAAFAPDTTYTSSTSPELRA
ncbi:MAG TPA: alpha/beta hydrolase [Gemmatimonadaceae bacterium]|nr:alpha/beta hydrolase [Gemmatimonadaceae bacterium]